MEEVVERAISQSPVSRQAETRKENRFWQYQSYRTNYNPQLRLNGSAPSLSKSFIPVRQNDGTIIFRAINQTNSTINLGLQQPIQWTGGNISVNSALNYFNDIERSSEQWNGTVFNIQLFQPIFAYNPLKWDKMTEPLRYEESKREYVEQREFISRQAVDLFFSVLQYQVDIQIARFNLANNDTIYKIEQGRYNIGTTSQDKLLQIELQLLRSRQAEAQASLDLETAALRLRSYIGLLDDVQFDLMLPDVIPPFDISVDEALRLAHQNRAAFIAFERRRLEAERDVAEARGNRFQTSLMASYGLNNSAFNANGIYMDPQRQQQLNVTFNIPIMDWGRNKAAIQTALANKRLNDYVIAQDEVAVEQEVTTQVRQFEMLRLQIEITKKSDEVAQQRYSVAQSRYLMGKIDITNLNIALNEKDAAKRSYIQALHAFWTAYYDLRRLTLYDFVNQRLLYTPE
ncbi:MAG TPA: TolC family protein [Cyclobacteriaceae bacterium]|nr:TolC family protein [Cyclobacteriaceae bacterium]